MIFKNWVQPYPPLRLKGLLKIVWALPRPPRPQRIPASGCSFFLWQKSDSAAAGHIVQAGTPLPAAPTAVMQWAHQTGSPGQTAAEVSAVEGKYSHAHAPWHSDREEATAAFPWLKINTVTTQSGFPQEVMELTGLFWAALYLLLHLWSHIHIYVCVRTCVCVYGLP